MKTPILTALLVIVNILPAVSATTASFTPQFTQADNTISQPSQYRDSIVLNNDEDDEWEKWLNDDESTEAEIHHDRGVKKYLSGDKRGALAEFNKAIALDPKFAMAYYKRGITKSNLGDKLGALLDFNRAISIKPNYAEAYDQRGSVKSDLGDKSGALIDFNRAISIKPNYALFYNSRGIFKLTLDDKRGAILDLDKAIALDSNYANSYEIRGKVKSMLKDNRSALVDLKRAADIYRQQGKMEQYQRVMASIREISG
jgi:tetratricopeptide (TPR) repeat protein